MRLLQNRSDALGWIGIACMGFIWLLMLAPKSMKTLIPVFNLLGPFSWLVPLAMIVLPVIAASRGSKWWLAVTTAGVITLGAFLRIALA
jgi:hypothetical protein